MEFLDCDDFDARMKINDFLIKSFSNAKPLIDTLMEEIKAVLPEKLEFESREKSWLKAYCLENPAHQEFDTWMKTRSSSTKTSSTGEKFLIQDLMEEIKPAIAEKKEFDSADLSKMSAIFRNFGLSGLWRKAENHHFFIGVFLLLDKVFDWDLDGIIDPCIFGENRVATYRKFNTICAYRYSLNMGNRERHVPVEAFLKYTFFNPQKLGLRKNLTSKNWKLIQLFTSSINFSS